MGLTRALESSKGFCSCLTVPSPIMKGFGAHYKTETVTE